jgi:tripartite ATP-independent transporter DctM subunit
MIVLLFEVYLLIRALIRPGIAPAGGGDGAAGAGRGAALRDVAPLIAIILVVLGGIYRGWTTPTEAAALGALMALAVAWIQRTLSGTLVVQAIVATVKVTTTLLFIVLGAQVFAFAVFTWGINSKVAEFVAGLAYAPGAIIVAILAMYFVLGMFIDALSMMVMTLAVVHPIVTGLGYDSVWFGIVLVLLLEIGLITPPVGLNLFTIQAIRPGAISLGEVAAGSLPFVVLLLIGVGLLVVFPGIALWLPGEVF